MLDAMDRNRVRVSVRALDTRMVSIKLRVEAPVRDSAVYI